MTDIPSWAHIGAKVVCTRSKWRVSWWLFWHTWRSGPKAGQVYTVTGGAVRTCDGGWGLFLRGQGPALFHAANFRPIVSKTESEDVEMFVEIASCAPATA